MSQLGKLPKIEQDFINEMRNKIAGNCRYILELDSVQAWTLFSNLQLALKHPENQGPSSQIVMEIALDIQSKVATTPAMKKIAEMGWINEDNNGTTKPNLPH
jgi:hypothetical protein